MRLHDTSSRTRGSSDISEEQQKRTILAIVSFGPQLVGIYSFVFSHIPQWTLNIKNYYFSNNGWDQIKNLTLILETLSVLCTSRLSSESNNFYCHAQVTLAAFTGYNSIRFILYL